MDSGTLSNPQFTAFVKDRFELVRIENEHAPDVFTRLGVKEFPTVIVLGPDGKELSRIEGDPGPEELQKKLVPFAKGA